MASELTLDVAEPDVAALVDGWMDGEEYDLNVKVRQVSPGKFAVVEVEEPGTESEKAGGPESGMEEPVPTVVRKPSISIK